MTTNPPLSKRVIASLKSSGEEHQWEQLIGNLLRRLELDPTERERAEADYEKLAERVAEKVVSSGKPTMLDPMNPAERRIIHCALQEVEGIVTYSEGEEPHRRVVVAQRED